MISSKPFNLIVPVAADKPEDENRMPSVFVMDKDGVMLCIRAVLGLNLEIFDNIYFTILKKHVEAFDIDSLLKLQLKRLGLNNAEILILEHPTATQAETIMETINTKDINGSIFIKDADCYFSAEVYPENGVAVHPLENLQLVDPRNKSYVAVDDLQHVTNIIEKKIVSNLFNAGGYSFEDADTFKRAYEKYYVLGSVYLSHIIYGLLLDGESFRPIKVADYVDFSLSLW